MSRIDLVSTFLSWGRWPALLLLGLLASIPKLPLSNALQPTRLRRLEKRIRTHSEVSLRGRTYNEDALDERPKPSFLTAESLEDPSFPLERQVFDRLCRNAGIERPTSVQKLAWPLLKAGQDHAIIAGGDYSGKTLAYLIPLLQRVILADSPKSSSGKATPRLLILAPKEKLVEEIGDICEQLKRNSTGESLFSTLILTRYTGRIADKDDHINMLNQNRNVDVLVSATSRIAAILQTEESPLDLSQLEAVVVDNVHELLIDEKFLGVQLHAVSEATQDTRSQFIFVTTMLPGTVVQHMQEQFPSVSLIKGPNVTLHDPTLSGTDSLRYLDEQGNINFSLVDWTTLNKWLSSLNGNVNVEMTIPKGLSRSDVIHELETRRNTNSGLLPRVVGVMRELCGGSDWREYENADGYTHLEELFLYQPLDWKIQAREFFIRYGCNLMRKSASRALRTTTVTFLKQNEMQQGEVNIFMSTPLLMVLFHPGICRVARYEPLRFLLSYGATNPLPSIFKGLTEDEVEGFVQELSPLNYFLEFQESVFMFDVEVLKAVGKRTSIPRIPLLCELDFCTIVGQRLAKHMIREYIATYFDGRHDSTGGVPITGPLSMVFAGPSGNGKTELPREVARLLNKPNDKAFLKVDCGKMSTATEFFGLSGAYQGAYEGSALNNFIVSISQEKDKVGVVLLDEIDKVWQEVITGLYQVLDKGEWTNKLLKEGSGSQTSVVPCHNVIFIMTVNAADETIVNYARDHTDVYTATSLDLMEEHGELLEGLIQQKLQVTHPFTPAFVGRINAFVPFLPMASETTEDAKHLQHEMMTVAKLLIEREKDNLAAQDIKQKLTPMVKHQIASSIVRKAVTESGVRAIQKLVNKQINRKIKSRTYLKKGESVQAAKLKLALTARSAFPLGRLASARVIVVME